MIRRVCEGQFKLVVSTAVFTMLIVPRLLADPGIFDVTAYGAIPNDQNDDSTAIQAAINAVPASGGVVYCPKGTYYLNQSINLQSAPGPVYLRGAGMEISVLVWRANVDGIVGAYAFNDFYVKTPATISDLTVAAGGGFGTSNTGIRLSFASNAGSIATQTARIFNVIVRQDPELGTGSTGWGTSIFLKDAWNAHINDVNIQYPVQYGIHATGQSNDIAMSKVKIFGRDNTGTGILIDGEIEGPMIDHSTIIGVSRGIDISTTCGVILPGCRPGGSIDHTFVSAGDIGIFVQSHIQLGLTSNTVYQGAGRPYVAIYLAGTGEIRTIGNSIIIGGAGIGTTSYGMVVDAGASSISGTSLNALPATGTGATIIGIWLTPTSSKNTVVGNIAQLPPGMTHILNGNTSNVLSANTP
jgi:Pectate lyase superfamily protein